MQSTERAGRGETGERRCPCVIKWQGRGSTAIFNTPCSV